MILKKLKWFAIPTVILLFICVILLVLQGIIKIVYVISLILRQDPILELQHNNVSAELLSIIDVFLLAIVIYVMAIGIYKFFIGNFESYSWIELQDMNDLKSHIAKMTVLFLTTFALQKIVEWGNPQKILYFGIVIALISAVLIWYSIVLKRFSNHSNGNPHRKGENTKDPNLPEPDGK